MPRVVMSRNFDLPVGRGLKFFPRGDNPLVVSQAEADAIVKAGAGAIVPTEGAAIPQTASQPRKRKAGDAGGASGSSE